MGVSRGGQGAASGDRVVDGVQAGRSGDVVALFVGGPVLVHLLHQLVQMAEDLVRGQVEGGEVVHGCPQPPHGGGGVQPVADHIADDEGDPGAGQGMTSNQSPPTPAWAGR